MIIAVDGPAGSGKSSVSKVVADKLKISYLDTGAMYRMITLYILENNIDIYADNIKELLEDVDLQIDKKDFYLNGKNVTNKIRTEEINKNISEIASIKEIREKLVALQQEIGSKTDSILDGRDIGTVVFPNADFKFYLEADARERANRRIKENQELGIEDSYDEILQSIIKRDELDSTRKESPLKQADDALLVDTTSLSFDEVVQKIIKVVENEY